MLRLEAMDDLFKRNLLTLRTPAPAKTFAEALFGQVSWATPKVQEAPLLIQESVPFTEKAQIMESLERYAQEKLGDPEAPKVIKIAGGEVALKAEPVWEGISQFQNFFDLRTELSLSDEVLELCLKHKDPSRVRIMFVPESFRAYSEFQGELREGFINQLLPAFALKTAELFARMLAAMKLEEDEVIIYPTMLGDSIISAETMRVAGFYKPEIIVTLGANSTHKILKGQERLAQVHGQFFNRTVENIGTFSVVPLFHPSIIETNQNMKKTAWADMQKIMKVLKKI